MSYTPKNNFNLQIGRTGIGKKGFMKKLLADVACCDESAYYFDYGFNPDVLVPEGSVTIKIRGGCSNFSWSTNDAEYTFTEAETSERTNTLNASITAETKAIIVTIQDSCGNTVSEYVNNCTPQVAPVQLNPAGGKVYSIDTMTLTCNTPGASIYYTTDGSEPTEASNSYGAPFVINGYSQIRAKAFKTYYIPSLVTSTSYTLKGILDSLEIETNTFDQGRQVHISGDVYAIVYDGWSGVYSGLLKTITISSTGAISDTVIDSFGLGGAGQISRPRIIHIVGDVFAIVYENSSNNCTIKTISISSNGTIGSLIETLEMATDSLGQFNEIINISGSIFAVVYGETTGAGKLITFTISDAGDISVAIESKQIDASCCYPKMIKVTTGMYAIVYYGSSKLKIKTIGIASDGNIAATFTDSADLSAIYGYRPDIIELSSTKFAIISQIYPYGNLKTITIATNGTIGAVIESFNYDGMSYRHNIIHISGDIYAICFQGSGYDGWIKTIEILSNGNIAAAITDSFEFDTVSADNPWIFEVSDTVCAVIYDANGDEGEEGMIKTIYLNSDGEV